jgi:hypothetical protein
LEAVAEAGCSSVFDLYYLVPNFSGIIGSLYRAIFGNAVAIYANICLYFSFFFIYIIIYLLYKKDNNLISMLKLISITMMVLLFNLFFTSVYSGGMEVQSVERLNGQILDLYQQHQLADSPPLSKLPIFPSADELVGWLWLALLIFIVILVGLAIQQAFWLYLCSVVISALVISAWFVWHKAHQYFAIGWFFLAGVVLGLACASMVYFWRVIRVSN